MSQQYAFTKVQGLGNDFIIIDGLDGVVPPIDLWPDLAKQWCSRRWSIGADGLCFLLPSNTAHAKMLIINEDGTEAEMCGNLIRCVAIYLQQRRQISQKDLIVETAVNNLGMVVEPHSNLVTVDMGEPVLTPEDIPVSADAMMVDSSIVEHSLEAFGDAFHVAAVSMGNPHGVIFVDNVAAIPLETWGPALEKNPFFPEKANIEFVEVVSREHAIVRVWERGAGMTLACGTGACAVLVAGVLTGRMDRNASIDLPGGRLFIHWEATSNRVMMTGPGEIAYSGTVSILQRLL